MTTMCCGVMRRMDFDNQRHMFSHHYSIRGQRNQRIEDRQEPTVLHIGLCFYIFHLLFVGVRVFCYACLDMRAHMEKQSTMHFLGYLDRLSFNYQKTL
jgi:hypothetical protein